MKTIGMITVLAIASLHGAIKVPKGIYGASEIEEAQAKALEEEKSLVFVLTNSNSN